MSTGDGRLPPRRVPGAGSVTNFTWSDGKGDNLKDEVFELALRWCVSQGATVAHMVQAVNESPGENWQGYSQRERDILRARAAVAAAGELSRIRGLAEWAVSDGNLDGVQKPIPPFGVVSPNYVAVSMDGKAAIVICAIQVKL